MDKGKIENVDSWIEDGMIYIIINYEDGGYDEMRLFHGVIIYSEYGNYYVPEGC